MEKEEKVLCRVVFASKWTKVTIIISIIILVVAFCMAAGEMWYPLFSGASGFIPSAVIAAIIPLVVFLGKFIAGSCALVLTDQQIYGQLRTLFSTRQIQIPIEKLDNIMTVNGLFDKLCGADTIRISSNSGTIKFHYVQNAEEFVEAALKRIEEVKQIQSAPLPTATSAASGSDTMEKLNSLKQMLEQGLLTQEEFDIKKKELLSKL